MRSSPKIMGIVNVTPDSFSDGGNLGSVDAAVSHSLRLIHEGADILDIGGESTRPGAALVSVEEELSRTIPVIEALVARTEIPISIDTRKSEVAKAAVMAGATIWNDVSALTFCNDSVELAAQLDCQLVLMHAQGGPETMQDDPHYDDVVDDIIHWLQSRIETCTNQGIDRSRLVLDPGIGFGKTTIHNVNLLKNLHRFVALGFPILLGASRKRFIAALDRDAPSEAMPTSRIGGSLAAILAAAQAGVDMVRVHDVTETRQAFAVWRNIVV